MPTPSPNITLITPSYRGDLALFRRLADSVERFASAGILHLVVVPSKDLSYFRPLSGPHTLLVSEDDILPARFFRLPKYLTPLRSGRNVFVRPGVWMPVRGWIMQQIVKFAASQAAPTDTVVLVDSDVILLRPLSEEAFRLPDGRLRLFQEIDVCGALPIHQAWYRHAARVLNLPSVTPFWGDNYVDDLVVWRKGHAKGVLERIEAVSGKSWWKVLAESKTFAEYMLYGIYVTNHLGGVQDQRSTDKRIHLTSWNGHVNSPEGRNAFVDMLQPDHLAVAIQSQAHLTPEDRNALIDRLMERAREQDAAKTGP